MRSGIVMLVAGGLSLSASAQVPSFKAQEIDKTLKIGYGVVLGDVNGDGKQDIIVADKERVVWFSNSDWKLHTILTGKTKPDNVCLDPFDIDGDGKLDLALGAGWRPADTKTPGTVQWLRQPKNGEGEWELIAIPQEEPTIHRMRFGDVNGDKKPELVVVPLQGRGATGAKNWSEAGVRVIAYTIPGDPAKEQWKGELISDQYPTMHNFQVVDVDGDGKNDVLTASYEGVHLHKRDAAGKWTSHKIGAGDQSNPQKNRGASEIKLGKMKNGRQFIGTIEPWHGNQVVVYVKSTDGTQWARQMIDNTLMGGHAVSTADVDGDGGDDLVIGVRDPVPGGGAKSGVRVYRPSEDASKWERVELDPGGVAVEDLAVGDLNGDGKPDIVAVGRATGNVRIYWNEAGKK